LQTISIAAVVFVAGGGAGFLLRGVLAEEHTCAPTLIRDTEDLIDAVERKNSAVRTIQAAFTKLGTDGDDDAFAALGGTSLDFDNGVLAYPGKTIGWHSSGARVLLFHFHARIQRAEWARAALYAAVRAKRPAAEVQCRKQALREALWGDADEGLEPLTIVGEKTVEALRRINY
jgi:hypothetical protein